MIKHVFFDLDNTLWDFRKNSFCALEQLYREQDISSKFGVDFESFYQRYSHYNELLWEQFRDHKITAEYLKKGRFALTFEELGIDDPVITDFFYENYLNTITNYNHLVPNSLELIEYLKPKYTLHILTNGFKDVTRRKINNSELKGHFATVTSAEEIDVRKPNPKIFEFAMDKAKANKINSAFIGDDWIADAIGARDFGFLSIFFNALNEHYEAENVIIVDSLLEIKNIL